MKRARMDPWVTEDGQKVDGQGWRAGSPNCQRVLQSSWFALSDRPLTYSGRCDVAFHQSLLSPNLFS